MLLSWLGGEPLLWPGVLAFSRRLRERYGLRVSVTDGSGSAKVSGAFPRRGQRGPASSCAPMWCGCATRCPSSLHYAIALRIGVWRRSPSTNWVGAIARNSMPSTPCSQTVWHNCGRSCLRSSPAWHNGKCACAPAKPIWNALRPRHQAAPLPWQTASRAAQRFSLTNTAASRPAALRSIRMAHDIAGIRARLEAQRGTTPAAACSDCPSTQVFAKFGI